MRTGYQTQMNNLDRFFCDDIKVFSRSYFDYLKTLIDSVCLEEVENFVKILLDARDRGSTVFFIGNGGSAATASHFANDLAFGTRDYEKPFRVMSLTDNASVLTALGNDNGYDAIFLKQIQIYGQPGDIVVGISASGNSKNLINTFEYCANAEIRTVAITAFDGGILRSISTDGIHIPTESKEYGPAEDIHMILNHLVGSYLMRIVEAGK